jgi:hypothetical protein
MLVKTKTHTKKNVDLKLNLINDTTKNNNQTSHKT